MTSIERDAEVVSDGAEPHTFLPRMLDYVAKWATAELVRGLLEHPDICAALAKGTTEDELCQIGSASKRQFRSLLQALEVEDIVVESEGVWYFTDFGTAAIWPLRGWFEIFLGGYGGHVGRSGVAGVAVVG